MLTKLSPFLLRCEAIFIHRSSLRQYRSCAKENCPLPCPQCAHTVPGKRFCIPYHHFRFPPKGKATTLSCQSYPQSMVHTESSFMRRTLDYSTFSIWTGGNTTGNGTDFDANLVRPQDVSVDAVVTSLYFNAVVFILLMAFYEFLRRFFPAVYSSRKRLTHILAEQDSFASSSGEKNVESSHDAEQYSYLPPRLFSKTNGMDSSRDVSSSLASLPDDLPLDWVAPVFGVPWQKVRKTAGLDGYFFLRYIRMNIRITAVSSFWFFLILVPIYATGAGNPQFPAQGWYHISASNLPSDGWRMWAPVVFAYLFSGFIFFVIKQEYKHFLELRQDFLAKGSTHVNPQHHCTFRSTRRFHRTNPVSPLTNSFFAF